MLEIYIQTSPIDGDDKNCQRFLLVTPFHSQEVNEDLSSQWSNTCQVILHNLIPLAVGGPEAPFVTTGGS